MIKENFWIKVASILLAIGLWMFVISKGRGEVTIRATVEIQNIPEGIVLTQYPEEDVLIAVRGHERFLRNLKPDDTRIVVDLSDFKAGEHRYHIGRSDVELPAALSVANMDPSSLDFTLEEAKRKTVPVRATLAGRPADGYAVSSVEVVPGEVEVLGAKNALRKLKIIETEPVDLSGITSTLEMEVGLDAVKKPYTVSVPNVTVRVMVGKDTK